MVDKKERYIACIVLHALGDTIGFKNSDWEFNYFKKNINEDYSNDMLYEFIELGGVNQINLKDWIVSDDTLFHMATLKALINKKYNSFEEIVQNLINEYKMVVRNIKNKNRYPGIRTIESLRILLEKKVKWNQMKYQWNKASGSGASMRTSCIGLIFHNNIDKLIEFSIEVSRLTHNNTIAYLGGLVSALFTSYAINNINIYQWGYKLLELFKSGKIDNYIKKTRGYKEYIEEKDKFINYWRRYIELRFTSNHLFKKMKNMRIPSERSKFFSENFLENKYHRPGNLGYDSVIIAYDALLDSENNWEKLIVYSMLHYGDSDTTGCIAASWYGALFGFKNVPDNNLKYIEFKKDLFNLGQKVYNYV